MSPEEAQAALEKLSALDNAALVPNIITPDELVAVRLVLAALKGIAAGDVLEPWKEDSGIPLKRRLVTRIDVRYFHPNAPRETPVPVEEGGQS
jgi:hypothetical protein